VHAPTVDLPHFVHPDFANPVLPATPPLDHLSTPRVMPNLHIVGRNFLSDATSPPRVRLGGDDLAVMRATPNEIFARLPDRPLSGALEVLTQDGSTTAHFVTLPPIEPAVVS
jgi:hypothetical protein